MRIIDIKSKRDIAYYIYAFMVTDVLEKVQCSIATNSGTPIVYGDAAPDFSILSNSLLDNDYRVLCTGTIKETGINVTLIYIPDSLSLFIQDSEPDKYEHIILSELKNITLKHMR